MKETTSKHNIRYLGFESMNDGSRRFAFSITAPGAGPQRASFEIPSTAFSGANRVTFQECAALCYEKLRSVIDGQEDVSGLHFKLSQRDIEEFRPRGRKAAAKTKA